MKSLELIKYWIFDLDNTLYSGKTKVFEQVDKKMSKFISDKLNVTLVEARKIQKNYFYQYNTTLNGMIKNHKIDASEFLDFVHDIDIDFLKKDLKLAEELEKLHTSIPSDILLVIDAAYSEYVTDKDYSVGFELAKDYENIVITKTFSKVFGLAGLRIGWAYCPVDISKTLSTLKVPFSVNVAAQKAAIQALKDDKFINSSVEHNSKWIKILEEKLSEMGLKVYPSQCNFLLVEFSPEVKISAPEAYDILCSKGLIVREMQEYNLPNCLRITIGTEEANLLLMDNLKDMVN